jgi:hypothetical protein
MPDWSRRHALQAVATTATLGLAGCSSETSRSRSVPPDRGDRVTDYEARFVRNTDGEPVVTVGEPGDEDENEDEPRIRLSEMHHLTDEAELDDIQFRDVTGAADLESFVAATDYESASVYLLQRQVGECYEPRLVGVFREDDGVDAEFCRELRPADVECDAEAHDVFTVAIRLAFPGDDFNSVGSGSSSSCDHERAVPIPEAGSVERGTSTRGDGQ